MKEQHDSDYSFLQEKIKERPINRKKLIRTSLNTAVFAVVFGLIACFVFILLEPVIGNWLNPPQEEPKQQIVLPAEEDEMLPEDMVQDKEELIETQTPPEKETSNVPAVEMQVTDYQKIYDKMRVIAYEATRSHVTVTAVREGTDWFQNRMERTNETSGMLVADNGVEIMILCNYSTISGATQINVTFCNEYKASASLKKYDRNTGLAVIAVRLDNVNEKTKNEIIEEFLGGAGE